MIIPDKYEDFEKMITRGIPGFWKRAQELKRLMSSFGVKRWPDPFLSSMLYGQAAMSYSIGLDLAAIMLASAASESLLRRILNESDEQGNGFAKWIKTAMERKLISSRMAQILDRLRRDMRNAVAHGFDELSIGLVGLRHPEPDRWETRDGEEAVMLREAALFAMETYLKLITEIAHENGQ